jgi:rhomboid family GlyGly-CTERM serine protease
MTWSDPSAIRRFRAPAVLGAIVVVLAAWPGAFEVLAWDRAAIAGGQWWRAVTGQFVHLGSVHAAGNLAGLALIVWLFRSDFTPAAWLTATAASMAGVAVGLQWLSPGVDWYAGLSGALHGILAAGAVIWSRRGRGVGWLLAAGLAGKLVVEVAFGPSAASQWMTGGPVLVAAHVWGAAGGLAWGLLWGGYNSPPRDRLPGDPED